MSRLNFGTPALSIYRGEDSSNGRPAVINFEDAVQALRPGRRPTRWVRATCPACEDRKVQTVTLNDAERDADGRPVEGTATVVGHHCVSCEHEWPVIPRAEGCG